MAPLIPVDNEGDLVMETRAAPPAHLLMKIDSFSKLSKHGIQKHESREFVAGKYKWKLIIYPQVAGGDVISVFLSISDTASLPERWEVNADCTILLHKKNSGNYFCFRGKARQFDATNSRWGFSITNTMLAELCCNGDDSYSFGAEVFPSKPHVSDCLSLQDWKISDFTKLEGVWNSQVFTAGGFRWKMKVYPNGNEVRDAKGKSVSIYLECVDAETFAPHEKVEAEFCIRIKSKLPSHAHLSKKTSHWFTCDDVDWGFSHFIPISKMRDPRKGFIVDDCCFIEAEISVLDAVHEPPKKKGHYSLDDD